MINPLVSRAMQNHTRTPYGVLPGTEEVKEVDINQFMYWFPYIKFLQIELATRHKESSPPAYLHLLLEAQILCRAYLWHGVHDPVMKELLYECYAMLGHFYAR